MGSEVLSKEMAKNYKSSRVVSINNDREGHNSRRVKVESCQQRVCLSRSAGKTVHRQCIGVNNVPSMAGSVSRS